MIRMPQSTSITSTEMRREIGEDIPEDQSADFAEHSRSRTSVVEKEKDHHHSADVRHIGGRIPEAKDSGSQSQL